MAEAITKLPYVYDKDNERLVAILTQIKTYASDDIEAGLLPDDDAKLWEMAWQILRRISSVACWDDEPDDLFLVQWRTQIYDTQVECGCVPNCCQCDDRNVIIPLEYVPYETEPFIDGEIVATINGEIVTTPITAEYLNSHLNRATSKLYIVREDFPDALLDHSVCCCLCQREVSIKLHYNAGYDLIPSGLLPIIVDLLKEKQSGSDDCHDNMTKVSGLLKRKKIGNVEYEWSTKDTSEANTASIYADIYDLGSIDEIFALSRCELTVQKEKIGDVV